LLWDNYWWNTIEEFGEEYTFAITATYPITYHGQNSDKSIHRMGLWISPGNTESSQQVDPVNWTEMAGLFGGYFAYIALVFSIMYRKEEEETYVSRLTNIDVGIIARLSNAKNSSSDSEGVVVTTKTSTQNPVLGDIDFEDVRL